MNSHLHTELELAEALHEWHSLDVANSAAQLDNAHLRFDIVFHRLLGHPFHPFLDGVRDMGNNWRWIIITLGFHSSIC